MVDEEEMAKKEEGNDEFLEITVTSPHKVSFIELDVGLLYTEL